MLPLLVVLTYQAIMAGPEPIDVPDLKPGEVMEVVSNQTRLCEKSLTEGEPKPKERGRMILMPL